MDVRRDRFISLCMFSFRIWLVSVHEATHGVVMTLAGRALLEQFMTATGFQFRHCRSGYLQVQDYSNMRSSLR